MKLPKGFIADMMIKNKIKGIRRISKEEVVKTMYELLEKGMVKRSVINGEECFTLTKLGKLEIQKPINDYIH